MSKDDMHLLPAETEMPAPAIITILRLFLSALTNCSSSSGCEPASYRSRRLVSRGIEGEILLRFEGGGPSSSVKEASINGLGVPFGECCESGGVGKPVIWRGGEGDRDRTLRLSPSEEKESSSMSLMLDIIAPSWRGSGSSWGVFPRNPDRARFDFCRVSA